MSTKRGWRRLGIELRILLGLGRGSGGLSNIGQRGNWTSVEAESSCGCRVVITVVVRIFSLVTELYQLKGIKRRVEIPPCRLLYLDDL